MPKMLNKWLLLTYQWMSLSLPGPCTQEFVFVVTTVTVYDRKNSSCQSLETI